MERVLDVRLRHAVHFAAADDRHGIRRVLARHGRGLSGHDDGLELEEIRLELDIERGAARREQLRHAAIADATKDDRLRTVGHVVESVAPVFTGDAADRGPLHRHGRVRYGLTTGFGDAAGHSALRVGVRADERREQQHKEGRHEMAKVSACFPQRARSATRGRARLDV